MPTQPPSKVRQIVRERVIRPVARFIQSQASSGVILLACTLVALVWANSPYGDTYRDLWHIEFSMRFGGQSLSMDLHHWINDGLMAVFFLLVGLEIKREILVGELNNPKKAALPIMAAIGGMLVPALIYVAMNAGRPSMDGWAIPMATDIAFSLGVLALLGTRAPLALKVFLAALAIVDDLGAVLVIALFYSKDINVQALQTGGLVFALLIVLNVLRVRNLVPYVILGFLLWLMFLQSGVHATIAGVLLAMTIPTRVRLDATEFYDRGLRFLNKFRDGAKPSEPDAFLNEDQVSAIDAIEQSCEQVQMPLQRLEHNLHTPVNFVIMPVFALANAGVALGGVGLQSLTAPVTSGVVLGLFIGKAVGISLFSWIGVKLGIAALPKRVTWSHVVGVAFLGGIGFTMSLFIAGLAFGAGELNEGAKLGVLLGSALSGVTGALLIVRTRRYKSADTVED
ncbi:MAG: Na+/H+ antiporter NhaA [Fimbriimonadaceae bacterium]